MWPKEYSKQYTRWLYTNWYASTPRKSRTAKSHSLIDIKPDSILINYIKGLLRFADVELADCGDVCRIKPEEYLKIGQFGPHIGAAILRSREAILNLRWGPSTDIWSFGSATVSIDSKPNPLDHTQPSHSSQVLFGVSITTSSSQVLRMQISKMKFFWYMV